MSGSCLQRKHVRRFEATLFIAGASGASTSSRFRKYLKLLDKSRVILEQELDARNAVAQHGDTFHTEAKSVSSVLLRIDATLREHLGMDHSAPKDFHPPRGLADLAGGARPVVFGAEYATDIDFGTGFDERKVTRS